MNKKRNIVISAALILAAVIYTLLVRFADVQAIGPQGSSVGFAWLNGCVKDAVGYSELWHSISERLGYIPFAVAAIYAAIGIMQMIRRKSILKMDRELWILVAFYAVVAAVYVLFEVVVVNCRPVLIDGVLEASYPSSHTLLAVSICISSVILNRKLFKNNPAATVENCVTIPLAFITVLGRIISGVHWFSDILGGLIISAALLMCFYTALCSVSAKK